MTEEITEVVDEWAEFRVNGVINLFLEGPADILDQEVPVGAKWGTEVIKPPEYDESGEPIEGTGETRQKLVGEFSPHNWPSVNEGNVVLLCAAMERPTVRQKAFSVQDAEDWKRFKELVWPYIGDFLTHKEAKSLMNEREV